jgi:xylan 1,4-beta-xylosidase
MPGIKIALRHLVVLLLLTFSSGSYSSAQEQIEVDARAPATPFPHFWEQMFGSGRAILSLRDSYREDLKAVKQVADFRYVRFHAILHDEVGVYNEDEHGNPLYNFSYVDQIYDGLLRNGVRPFVEISFMPKKLAFNPDDLHVFWYKPNVSPPKSLERWDDLVTHFARHLVERYGIDEVSQWYFEVWNEPNIDFWGGIPRKKSYVELYEHTARALKSVSPRLRVGGPATAAAAWIPEFLAFTAKNNVPVDFVSTHGYADDTVENLFGTSEDISMDDRVCRAVGKVEGEIRASSTPRLPLFWTEWNVQGMKQSRDTIFVGPALANTIRECDGKVDMLSFWTFSDVFEEGGPIPRPFEGQFGLRAKGGINKPSYYAYELLHKLGDQRLANADRNLIVTKTVDGSLVVVIWNLVDPDHQGRTVSIKLNFEGVLPNSEVDIARVDADHGNVLKEYAAIGSPLDPTPAQVDELNRRTALPEPVTKKLTGNTLAISLEPNALLLLRLPPGPKKNADTPPANH